MVAAFPLAKIGLLLMKQLSKPLANAIKNKAKKHPYMRKIIIIPTGKAYNWVEQRANYVRGQVTEEVKLTEDEIVELGSNAIGEIILFGLLTVILLAEYNRQGDKKAVIQKIKEDEISNVITTLLDTIDEMNKIKTKVEKIEKSLVTGLDAVELEEEKHPPVFDNDFLDVMLTTKQKIRSHFGFKAQPHIARDASSPSE